MTTATLEKPKKTRKKLIKLDIACGQNKQKGFVGIDISPDCDADIVHDLNVHPWPFEDNSVKEAFCSHYVEHMTGEEQVAFMEELYRVMKDGAQVRITHPHLHSDRAFQDPFHKQFIPEARWYYFAKDWREQQGLDHYPISCDFGIEAMFYNALQGDWAQRSEQTKAFALAHYWNVPVDLVVDLKARK